MTPSKRTREAINNEVFDLKAQLAEVEPLLQAIGPRPVGELTMKEALHRSQLTERYDLIKARLLVCARELNALR
jgi:hypothetical protein